VRILSTHLTVGICAYNEDKNIGQLLENISHQGLGEKSEVLIICSGCTDRTVEIAQAYAEKDTRISVFVENERKGKAAAVNRILANAKGSTILFVSADTLPHDRCFSNLVSRLNVAANVGVVCGKPVPITDVDTLVGRLVRILWLFHDHVFKELNDAGIARHASEVFCIRKDIAEKLPLETVNDDSYLAVMAKKKGWMIKYEPNAVVSISGPKTFLDYFLQRRRIIFGHYQIKKLTGETPQYLVHLMLLYPKKALKLTTWLCARCGFRTFLFFVTVESTLNVLAIMDFVLGKSYVKWGVSSSTKTVNIT
jgi:cellulose synthase/poly-beta-1,6-N-acetylglucosamine synthase-like glycosyltransferase